MLRTGLGARRHGEDERLVGCRFGERAAVGSRRPGDRLDVGQPHLALGQRAGLVEDDRVDLPDALEDVAALEQDPVPRRDRRADHRRRGRREPQRAGAGDEDRRREDDHRELEHRDAAGDRAAADLPDWKQLGDPVQLRREGVPKHRPDGGVEDDRGDEVRADAVDEPLDVRLSGLGLLDPADDPLDRGVLADVRRLHEEDAVLVDRRADDLVAGGLLDRDGLAGQHRLVDGRLALGDDPVGRDPLAGADLHHVADFEVLDRNRGLLAVADHGRVVGLQFEQFPQRVGGAGLRAGLEPVADGNEPQDERDGLEVEVAGDSAEDDRGTEQIASARPDGDERVHVRRAVSRRRVRADEELPSERRHQRRRDDELDPADGDAADRLRFGQRGEHRRHQIYKRKREDAAEEHEPSLFVEFAFGGGFLALGVGIVALDRFVARLGDGRVGPLDRERLRVVLDGGLVGSVVH